MFLEVDAFSKFSTVVQKVAEAHPDMPLVRIVSLHLALLQFVIKVYKDRLDCVDQVLVRDQVPGETKCSERHQALVESCCVPSRRNGRLEICTLCWE